MLPIDIFAEIYKYLLSNAIKYFNKKFFLDNDLSPNNYENIFKKIRKKYILPLSCTCSAAREALKLFDESGRYNSFLNSLPPFIFKSKKILLKGELKKLIGYYSYLYLRYEKNLKYDNIINVRAIHIVSNSTILKNVYCHYDELYIANCENKCNEFIEISIRSIKLKINFSEKTIFNLQITDEDKYNFNTIQCSYFKNDSFIWAALDSFKSFINLYDKNHMLIIRDFILKRLKKLNIEVLYGNIREEEVNIPENFIKRLCS
jgi:hypothetical protein